MNPRTFSVELTMAATVSIVLALCALANGAFLRRPHLDGRIVGGDDADIKDYPYQVETPFSFGKGVQPVDLAANEPAAGDNSAISGWGALQSGGTSPWQLQVINVPIVGRDKCSKSYGGITARMICAGLDEGGKDVCKGDSGGPLAVGGKLAGIVSFGNACGYYGDPGVYSNVANQRAWIEKNSNI